MEVINDPDVEAVWICSPSQFHADQIKAAAKSGKHIFCEKPIATDLAGTIEAVQVGKDGRGAEGTVVPRGMYMQQLFCEDRKACRCSYCVLTDWRKEREKGGGGRGVEGGQRARVCVCVCVICFFLPNRFVCDHAIPFLWLNMI